MLHGSCLCRGIRYEIDGELADALNCHCSMCRKAHGAAFRSRARVRAADFRLVGGEELMTFYESSNPRPAPIAVFAAFAARRS
jgi:hypothetical protein